MYVRTLRIELQDQQSDLSDAQRNFTTASLAIAFGDLTAITKLSQRNDIHKIATHWLAGSSCLGFADSHGVNITTSQSVTVLLIDDPTGHYGIGSAEFIGDIRQQASQALQQAMNAAGKSHELPKLIWTLQAPGQEELVLQGIQDLVGTEVPIFGGSTADNDVSGAWVQFDGKCLGTNRMIFAVFYPSTPLSSYFSSGYYNTPFSGTVTAIDNRVIQSIDHQPAAKVYNEWLQHTGSTALASGNILMESTLYPLGREIKREQNLPFYLLSHPAKMHDDGSLTLFSEMAVGEHIWLMQGNKDDLIARAGEVVRTAKQSLNFHYNTDVAGAIIVYCAGCMLAVKENLADVHQAIKAELGDIPFVVTFTFGEQGCFIDDSNRHGNLMISAVLLGATHAYK